MTREQMDATLTTLTRAQNAIKEGHWNEICKVTIKGRKGDVEVAQDELPGKRCQKKSLICVRLSLKTVLSPLRTPVPFPMVPHRCW